MRGRDLLAFAAGALRGHRLRTSLSLVGVAVGVASVVILTSLGEGARLYVMGEFSLLGTNLLIVLPGKTETTGMSPIIGGAPHDLTLEDVEAIVRRVPQVRRAAPLVVGTLPARFGERRRDITVAGTTSDWLHVRKLAMAVGRYLPPGALGEQHLCVIGPKVQAELFPSQNPLGEVLRLGDERFRVVGVTAPRGVSLGLDLDEVVHIPVARALKIFNRTSLFRVLVEARSADEIPTAKAAVLRLLKERHDNEEDVTVFTQDAVVSTFGKILTLLTAALAGIAAISLVVAGVGIMNVMLVSVSERTREIGLLKAVGVRPRQVLGLFLVEAAIISTAGGILGLLLGGGAARLARALYPAVPFQPPVWAVAGALLLSAAVGLLFGAIPARRASRLDPVAALARR